MDGSPAEGVEEAQRALDRAGARAAVGAALAAKTRRALDELAEQRKGVRGRPDKAHTTKKRRLEDALTRLDAGWLPGDEPPRPPVTLVGAALEEAPRRARGAAGRADEKRAAAEIFHF